MKSLLKIILLTIVVASATCFGFQKVEAQGVDGYTNGVLWAKVSGVKSSEIKFVNNSKQTIQTLSATITHGDEKGKNVIVENPLSELKAGEKILIRRTVDIGGYTTYFFYERVRLVPLFALLLLFIISVIALGGKQGVASLFSLAGSVLAIVFVLNPLLLAGYSPVVVSVVAGSIIAACAIFLTHGFKRGTLIAYGGTLLSVAFALAAAFLVQYFAKFSGYTSEDAVYLTLNTGGKLDIAGIMMGSIVVSMLGVLDDIAITQVAVVGELKKVLPNAKPSELFKRAIVVGKDHAAALVNTLVLAYTGSALPMILFLQSSKTNFLILLNQETFALEIVKMLVGSFGLIVCVPIVTYLASYFLTSKHAGDCKGCPGCSAKLVH